MLYVLQQESLANAKVSARQRTGRNSLNRPPLRIAQQYQRNPYIVEKYFQCATITSLTMRVYLHSFSRCCLPNMPTSAKFRENLQQFKVIQASKVNDFGTNRKCICHFLLVINSNFGPILQFLRYGDLLAENCTFFIPSLIRHPRSPCSLWNF